MRLPEIRERLEELAIWAGVGNTERKKKMRTLNVAGESYTPEAIMVLRAELIQMRDAGLVGCDFYNAVTLSHTIALLYAMVEDLKKQPDDELEILELLEVRDEV